MAILYDRSRDRRILSKLSIWMMEQTLDDHICDYNGYKNRSKIYNTLNVNDIIDNVGNVGNVDNVGNVGNVGMLSIKKEKICYNKTKDDKPKRRSFFKVVKV